MPDFPEFEDCQGCKKPRVRPQVQLFEIPTCPDQVDDSDNTPCSTKPRYYSRLTRDFVLPAPGQVASMYVCDADLFTSCSQWVGVCNVGDQTGLSAAFLRILSVKGKILQVYNGCSSTNPVIDNPITGTVFKSGTSIYPAPPSWCSAQFDKFISDAITNADGLVVTAILAALAASDEICFSSVPALVSGDDSEVGIFGGIIEGGKQCLRFLNNIITGSVGTTFCFPQIPPTSDTPEVISGSNVPKNYIYLTEAGCMARGRQVAQECNSANDYNPLITNATIRKIWICDQDGNRKNAIPSASGQALVSFKDTDAVFKWRIQSLINWILLGNITLFNAEARGISALGIQNMGTVPVGAGSILIGFDATLSSSTGDNETVILVANGVTIGGVGWVGAGLTSFQQNTTQEAWVPADPTTPGNINWSGSAAGGTTGASLSLIARILAWQ